jgi:hypothetical protein
MWHFINSRVISAIIFSNNISVHYLFLLFFNSNEKHVRASWYIFHFVTFHVYIFVFISYVQVFNSLFFSAMSSTLLCLFIEFLVIKMFSSRISNLLLVFYQKIFFLWWGLNPRPYTCKESALLLSHISRLSHCQKF